MWLFRSIILAYAIAQTKSVASDNLSPLLELNNGGVHWALLVAGSKGWGNYRHQADVCHAYQILHQNGIPDERIVVMMYDDIAYNEENPHKGVIINQINGTNVYKCVPKDYTGSAVTADVFLKVLQGQKEGMTELGSGKVIKSGPNDNIFVFFADHGGFGFLEFPDTHLYASKLISTLNKMYNAKKYAKMLIYVEACQSGSIFKYFPKKLNVFAMTAANETENSYACCYDSDLKTYLGDVFSDTWMKISETVSLNKITILEQYDIVKKKVNRSHVKKFGNMSVGKMKLSDFQGSESDLQHSAVNSAVPNGIFDFSNSVNSRDVTLEILIKKWEMSSTHQEKEDVKRNLYEYFKEVDLISNIFRDIVESITQKAELVENFLNTPEEITDTECYEEAVEHFYNVCSPYRQSEHILEHLNTFVNLCNEKFEIGLITGAISRRCSLHKSNVIDLKMFSNSVNSHHVTLETLIRNWEEASSEQEKEDIKMNFSEYFKSIGKIKLSDFLCSESDLRTSAFNPAVPDTIFDSNLKMKFSDFQCSKSDLQTQIENPEIQKAKFDFSNSVNSRDVSLEILIKRWEKASRRQEKEDIEKTLSEYFKERHLISNIFREIVGNITQENELVENLLDTPEEITDTECYEEAVDHFYNVCSLYRHNEHILEYLNTFVNLCNEKFEIVLITDAINRGCSLRNSTVKMCSISVNSANSRHVTLENLMRNWEEARSQQEKEDLKIKFSEYFMVPC